MGRQFFIKDYASKILTEEEMAEKRRQRGMLGVKLDGSNKFSCEKKLMDTCTHFFHDHTTCGKCRIDGDGKLCIVIYTLNQPLLHEFIKLTSDEKNFHKFLNGCYERICEIHEKRLEARKAAHQADQDNVKQCQDEHEDLNKNQSSRQSDHLLQKQQKTKKPPLPFAKDNYETWSSLSSENAQESKDRLTAKKTELLQKINDIDTILKGEKR